MEEIIRIGWGGQAIIIFPSLDKVVVITGGDDAYDNYLGFYTEIVNQCIQPAV